MSVLPESFGKSNPISLVYEGGQWQAIATSPDAIGEGQTAADAIANLFEEIGLEASDSLGKWASKRL